MINDYNLDFDKLNEKIKHLTKPEIYEVISKYYSGVAIKEIKKEFNINVIESKLVTIFPRKITNILCKYCEIPMVEDWQSRNNYAKIVKSYCPNCDHKPNKECNCSTCKNIREKMMIEEEKKKKEIIFRAYHEDIYTPVPEDKLTLKDKLYLAVVLRAGLEENSLFIKPIQTITNVKISPTTPMTTHIIQHLADNEFIVPANISSVEAFKEEGFPNVFYVYKVYYRINIAPVNNDYSSMINRLMYPNEEDFKKDIEFCFKMWKEIGKQECIEYLRYSIEKVNFEFSPGEKTNRVFENLLNHFSVGQIYNIIYRSVANATKSYQEKKTSRKHAANSVITFCESYGERAIAENWNITNYRRNFDLPETVLVTRQVNSTSEIHSFPA